MTTVVSDGISMGADRRVGSDSYTYQNDFIKMVKIDKKTILGISGTAADLSVFVKWYKDKSSILNFSEKFMGLRLVKDPLDNCLGVLTIYDSKGREVDVTPPFGIGSGAPIAIAALKAGANIHRAVEIACEMDVYSCGDPLVYNL
jgi:ATP-dependent protease HslVU (ClpYQ) peptidase subunit